MGVANCLYLLILIESETGMFENEHWIEAAALSSFAAD